MSEYLDRAKELRAITEPHYNCAQSVLIPFAEHVGMSTQQAFDVANAFGGGMRTGSVCGALTGALMALGVLGIASNEAVAEVTNRMTELHGTKLCSELLQMNAETGGEKKLFCNSLIYEAIGLVEEQLNKCEG